MALRLKIAPRLQIHVHHYGVSGGDVVVVQRTHPISRDSYVFICRTAFEKGAQQLQLSMRLRAFMAMW